MSSYGPMIEPTDPGTFWADDALKKERQQIAQSLAQSGYGRAFAIVPTGKPSEYYVGTESRLACQPSRFHVCKSAVPGIAISHGDFQSHKDRCSAVIDLRDRAGFPSWWTPGELAGV
jgi:hypothetical protein